MTHHSLAPLLADASTVETLRRLGFFRVGGRKEWLELLGVLDCTTVRLLMDVKGVLQCECDREPFFKLHWMHSDVKTSGAGLRYR